MEVKLGIPKHGWVDLVITHENFFLRDTISDVPCDFIGDMVVGLSNLISHNEKQQFTLGLEPDYYEIDLAKENDTFLFRIQKVFETPNTRKPQLLHEMNGSANEVLFPLYFAIRAFYKERQGLDDWHWPTCDSKELENLVKLMDYAKTQ